MIAVSLAESGERGICQNPELASIVCSGMWLQRVVLVLGPLHAGRDVFHDEHFG